MNIDQINAVFFGVGMLVGGVIAELFRILIGRSDSDFRAGQKSVMRINDEALKVIMEDKKKEVKK